MRASFLGSNPLTILVRCTCGVRHFFDRLTWSRLGNLLCDNCGACIVYDSLAVIKPCEVTPDMTEPTDDEVRNWREIETTMRAFVKRFGENPEWHWAPPTAQMVNSVKLQLKRLDELRSARPSQEAAA